MQEYLLQIVKDSFFSLVQKMQKSMWSLIMFLVWKQQEKNLFSKGKQNLNFGFWNNFQIETYLKLSHMTSWWQNSPKTLPEFF